jgi:hypothetical protein
MVMDTGVPVFCLDNRGYKDAAKFLPALEEHFQLQPVKKWSSEELRIHRKYISERSYLQLYRVLPWREKEVSIRVPTGSNQDRILAVDLRSLWKDPARNEVRIFLNDHRLSGTVVDNLNYIFLDHRLTSTPQSIVRFASDRGLPGDIPVVLNVPVEDGLTIDLGRKAAPSEILFQDGEFFSTSRTGRYRTMDRRAGIKIPTANVPGRVGYLKIKVRNNLGPLSPVYLNLDLHRRSLPTITIPPEYRWTVVEKRFPAGEAPVSTSWLTLRAIPVVSSSEVERTRAEKGILSIDWLAIEWCVAPTKSELNFNSRTK